MPKGGDRRPPDMNLPTIAEFKQSETWPPNNASISREELIENLIWLKDMAGGDWLRQEIQFACVQDGSGTLPKKFQTLSANKTARGVRSPIQVADLGLVLA
jgi:hypothetical protein